MKKYVKKSLALLTCVAMCVQSPLVVVAQEKEITTYAQSEAQWIKDSAGWWYQNADGSYPSNQWQMINGSWYHFDWNGYMQTGWYREGSNVYYLKADGKMAANEWVENGKYYIDANGHWV